MCVLVVRARRRMFQAHASIVARCSLTHPLARRVASSSNARHDRRRRSRRFTRVARSLGFCTRRLRALVVVSAAAAYFWPRSNLALNSHADRLAVFVFMLTRRLF